MNGSVHSGTHGYEPSGMNVPFHLNGTTHRNTTQMHQAPSYGASGCWCSPLLVLESTRPLPPTSTRATQPERSGWVQHLKGPCPTIILEP